MKRNNQRVFTLLKIMYNFSIILITFKIKKSNIRIFFFLNTEQKKNLIRFKLVLNTKAKKLLKK